MGFYGEIQVFFKSAVYAYLGQTEPISTVKKPEFSHENHVLYLPASKMNVSL
jgi:hypothetical protein